MNIPPSVAPVVPDSSFQAPGSNPAEEGGLPSFLVVREGPSPLAADSVEAWRVGAGLASAAGSYHLEVLHVCIQPNNIKINYITMFTTVNLKPF